MAERGEVFLLDMGEPVRIVDLACDLIRLRGLEPGVDIELRAVGMRPGEKLHEELSSESEQLMRSAHPGVFVARTPMPSSGDLERIVERLAARLGDQDERTLRDLLFAAVAESRGPDDGVRRSTEQSPVGLRLVG